MKIAECFARRLSLNRWLRIGLFFLFAGSVQSKELVLGGKKFDDIRADLGRGFLNSPTFYLVDEEGDRKFQIVLLSYGSGLEITEVVVGNVWEEGWSVESYVKFFDRVASVDVKVKDGRSIVVLHRHGLGKLVLQTSFKGKLLLTHQAKQDFEQEKGNE